MGKLSVFQFTTLNGYFKGPDNSIDWHRHGDEEAEFAAKGAQSESILLFGRKTFEMMASYWPTPMAKQNAPAVADGMNKSKKIVFSQTLKHATWNNTSIIRNNMIDEVQRLKNESDKPLTLLGSGSVLTQLADAGLIDEFQFMIDPVALGSGTPTFSGMNKMLDLTLTGSHVFKSGVVLLSYAPTKS